jgi:pyridoxine 5-phosphate synthase
MATALSVNLNKIALIRNSRETKYPCVVAHAKTCIEAGAQGITVHPRPDQRHIRPADVYDLANFLKKHPTFEYNIEGNPFAEAVGSYPGFMTLIETVRPHQCTLVPDSGEQLTSDHGFDLVIAGGKLKPIIDKLHDLGVRVSLFMDPVAAQIKLAKEIGADRIELYTGPYADAVECNQNVEEVFQQFYAAATVANKLGLGVNAGHDLNLKNLGKFAAIPNLLEVSIGHALIIDALDQGLANAVRAYLAVLK